MMNADVDYASGYRNDLAIGWGPDIVLGMARKHLEALHQLPETVEDREQAISDVDKLIAELVAGGYSGP
jgi:hypothetical protein